MLRFSSKLNGFGIFFYQKNGFKALSLTRIDVYIRPKAQALRVNNNLPGIIDLTQQLQSVQPELIVLEATEGMELDVAEYLSNRGLAVSIINPRQARDFGKATGKLAKTDAIDAQVLAHFAEAIRPTSNVIEI